jgi:glyceraldehyde-3-phosphate dehydrogenase (NADP+)
VLPIITFKNEEEAIRINNACKYGLDAAIFTKNIKRAKEIAARLEVGQVFINIKPHRAPDEFPFTGIKDSGLGTQGIPYTQKEMTKIKSVRTSS